MPKHDMSRDPLIDPRAGDQIEKDGKRRIVDRVELAKDDRLPYRARNIYYRASGKIGWGKPRVCWIATWQEWCRHARVESVAPAE